MDAGDNKPLLLLLLLALPILLVLPGYLRSMKSRLPRRVRPDSAPPTTPEERVAAWVAREIATHGVLRPPWVHAPGHDPWSITWRMGDDGYLELWASWAHDCPRSEVAAIIRRYGAVPADWAPWAAAVACELPPSQGEATPDDEESSVFHEPFEHVRALLAATGIEVSGEPSQPAAARR